LSPVAFFFGPPCILIDTNLYIRMPYGSDKLQFEDHINYILTSL